jgi:hypothetical protein
MVGHVAFLNMAARRKVEVKTILLTKLAAESTSQN